MRNVFSGRRNYYSVTILRMLFWKSVPTEEKKESRQTRLEREKQAGQKRLSLS